MESMSLMLALLGVDPAKGLAAIAAAEPTSPAGKFYSLTEEQKKQVMEGLYKVLYLMLEEYEIPSNRAINRAIGKALARAIHGKIPGLEADKDVTRMREILQPVVTAAVEELRP